MALVRAGLIQRVFEPCLRPIDNATFAYNREDVKRGILQTYGDLNTNKTAQRLWMKRLENFIYTIMTHRKKILSEPAHMDNALYEMTTLMPDNGNFFDEVKKYPKLKVVLFGEKGDDVNYHFLNNTFEWICDERLYQAITMPSKSKFPIWYPKGCEKNISKTFVPKYKMDDIFWRNKQEEALENDIIHYQGFSPIPTFHILVEDGIVTTSGYVVSRNVKIATRQCGRDATKDMSEFSYSIPCHNEVFVTSQFWGQFIYHGVGEDFTRIGPYISFLKQHLDIKIHVLNIKLLGNFFALLGIDGNRLVDGTVYARLVYVPEGTPCGQARVLPTQLLARALRVQMMKIFPQPPEPKREILIIKRTKSRMFIHHEEIVQKVREIAQPHGYSVTLFEDDPLPPFSEVAHMFFRAAMVIAPHGAGLVNVIFSEPGTVVIEGLCHMPHVNLCHKQTAVIVGHHYYGTTSISGCEEINNLLPSDIAKPVRFFLTRMK